MDDPHEDEQKGQPVPSAGEADHDRQAQALAVRLKADAEARLAQAEAWVGETAGRRSTFELAVAIRRRDREAFASVLGSAIALRLFLFSVALIVAVVSALHLAFGEWAIDAIADGVGVSGDMAAEIGEAAEANTGRDVGVLISATMIALLAGRSLTLVLAACSAGAWRLDPTEAKAAPRMVLRVTALISLIIIAASGLHRLREAFGPAVATSSVALNLTLLGIGWFFVTRSLPKPTRDPGAMLPGAALFAIALTLVQWFMHYYLPYKVENASKTMGSLSLTVASLGYLFAVGRLMAGCVVVNAVLWERFGSISGFVFRLPWLRRIPERFPGVATYFDLENTSPKDPT